MNREEAIKRLEELKKSDDREVAHMEADNVLMKFLLFLGYTDVISVYREIEKYYS